jgi:hypothetical protein
MAVGESGQSLGEPAFAWREDRRKLLLFAARQKAGAKMGFDRGDDGNVARLDTF